MIPYPDFPWGKAKRLPKAVPGPAGFTIAELSIAVAILSAIMVFSLAIYSNFFDSMRDLKASNLVYEEARFLMDRMVKEARESTLDYEAYFGQSLLKDQQQENYDYLRNQTYGQDYCQYSRQFYQVGSDGEIGTLDDKSTGIRSQVDPVDGLTRIPPAIGRLSSLLEDEAEPLQENLFLISIEGDRRVYFKRIEGQDGNGNAIGQVGMVKLIGKDFGLDHINALDPLLDGSAPAGNCQADVGEGDGKIDTWICESGFPCQTEIVANNDLCQGAVHSVLHDPNAPEESSFVPISPSSLDIVDLSFVASPMDDPRKAYGAPSAQIQPGVTIKLTAQAAPQLSAKLIGNRSPGISLESTVSSRVYSEIVSECNLKQCTPGVSTDRSCPLTSGVCGPLNPGDSPAQQSCVDYIWAGCTPATYESYSDATHGEDPFFAGGRTYYENGLEYKSCNEDLALCDAGCFGAPLCLAGCDSAASACKAQRCEDGKDNDCSGTADGEDPACSLFLCTDGAYAPGVEEVDGCVDVGGLCQAFRPLQEQESSCNDGYDNDCDGFADQFDADCVELLCSNGQNDPGAAAALYPQSPVNLFLDPDFSPKGYLFSAQPTDHAGTSLNECSGGLPSPDVGGLCSFCLDTLTGQGACECGTPGCGSEKIVPGQDLDVAEGAELCFDGLDNDCDGAADEFDADCLSSICENEQRDCSLAPSDYTPLDYLGGYSDASCGDTGPAVNDEACADVGGLCQGHVDGMLIDHSLQMEESGAGQCQDGLDNDCDGAIDWAEPGGACCAFGPYCVGDAGASFTDLLESPDFIESLSPGLSQNLPGGYLKAADPFLVDLAAVSASLPLPVSGCSSYSLSLSGTEALVPGGSALEFQLSDDGGATWCGDSDCAGDSIPLADVDTATVALLDGSNVKWKATFSGDGADSPQLDKVRLSYSDCL